MKRPRPHDLAEDATESLADLVESGLSGAEKISLIAEVTLKAARPG